MQSHSSSLLKKVKNIVSGHSSTLPQIVVSIIPSSSTFSISSRHSQDSFSITLEAFVTGTNSQPLTVYSKDTLLQPSAVRATLENRGLVFTDIETGESMNKVSMPIKSTSNYKTETASEASSFFELPAMEEGRIKGSSASYRVTYECEKAGLYGLKEGKDYQISLGKGLTNVKWWKVGSLEEVVDKGMRKLIKLQTQATPDSEQLKMQLVTNASFHVTT